jgi:cobalt-zinc-cadmium efflux system membrane fusion protein
LKIATRIELAAVAFALTACGGPAPEAGAPDVRLEGETILFPAGSEKLAKINSKTLSLTQTPTLRLNGRLAWNEDRTVRVYTPFAGRVEKILVQPGDPVKQGQALAVIASPDFGQAQADARRADADFALAAKSLSRVKELEENGVAPRKDLESASADYARAGAERERTRSRLRLYGSTSEGVDQTYTLKSPIGGVVVEKSINPGQELRPDQLISGAPALFVITNPRQLWVIIDALEKDLPALTPNKTFTVRTPVYHDEDFTGTIVATSDFLDPVTRTIKVRGTIDNSHHRLRAEMFITAEIEAKRTTQLEVPARAVFFQGGDYFVFTDDGNGKYTRRKVRVGDEREELVAILDGLHEGQNVVTEGSLMLQQLLQPRRIQK